MCRTGAAFRRSAPTEICRRCQTAQQTTAGVNRMLTTTTTKSDPKELTFCLETAYLNKGHKNLMILPRHFQMRNFDSSQTGI